jgi:hypothetical protein
MVAEIRGALDVYPREQLQEILAWVFKEYVVEGGAAPAQGALAMLDARSELEGLSFAELVTWLQLHLDVPELAAFEVQGDRVSVRAGGRSVPIEVARAPEPAPAPQPVAPPAPQPVAPSPPVASAPTVVSTAQPLGPAPAAAPVAPPAPQPQAAEPKKEEEGSSSSSRFSWLEVD